MKAASAQLIAHLNSATEFVMADLFTITLNNGTVLRYTSADVPLVVGGNTFANDSVLIRRASVNLRNKLEVSSMTLDIYPSSTAQINGQLFMPAAVAGVFDGAQLTLERAFLDDGLAVIGTFAHFSGRVARVDSQDMHISAEIKSDLELLNIKLPRNIYQPGCQHTLYSAACGVNRANHAVNATLSVNAGNKTTIYSPTLTQADDYFALGYVQFNTGTCAGEKRTIKFSTAQGFIGLLQPLPAVPATGDSVTLYRGCDKTKVTCEQRFNNVINFRGMPFVPIPETSR